MGWLTKAEGGDEQNKSGKAAYHNGLIGRFD
jgi:hypothetical protein